MSTFFIITVIILLIYTFVGYKVYKQSNSFSKHMIWGWLPMIFLCWCVKSDFIPFGCQPAKGTANG